mgnify:CR=1 FL=1
MILNLKQTVLPVILFTILICNNSFSQTLFVENFNYPVRDSIEYNGGWNLSGSNTPNNIKVVSPGLNYPGYTGSGIGNCVSFSNPVSGDIALNAFSNQTSGTVYLSFLIRVDSLSASATEGYNICLDAAGASTNLNTHFFIKKINSSTFYAGVRKSYDGTINYSPMVLSKNTTYLIVCTYTYLSGTDNDLCKIYINTSGIPATEPAVPSVTSTSGTDITSIGEVAFSNSFIENGLLGSSVKIDGIRIGTTWNNTLFQSINVQLNLKALIQGFYSGVNDKMIKDTARVVLRYNLSPYSIADSSKVVLDSNGNGNFTFTKIGNLTPYYIVVKHRNTIETWSKTPNEFQNNSYNLDILSGPDIVYGNNVIQVGSKYCLYNGDVNQDRSVDLNDVVAVNNNASVFATGYKITDVTGDNYTDLTDLILSNNNASKFILTLKP